MHKITVYLPANRDYAGLLAIEGTDGKKLIGPLPVCGRADDDGASAQGNPNRNPLLAFGDMPLGEYQAVKIIESGPGTPYDSGEFGSAGIVLLEPRRGDAALADANGRFGFFIHGGRASTNGALRPTDGSLRLSNPDQRKLIGFLRRKGNLPCPCAAVRTEHAGRKVAITAFAGGSGGIGGQVKADRSEQLSAAEELVRLTRRFWLRKMLLATGASVAIPSALVFTLQSAFGQEAQSDYSDPAPAPEPAAAPEPTAVPEPAPIVDPGEELRDAPNSQTAGNTTNLGTAIGTNTDSTNAAAAQSDDEAKAFAEENFDTKGSTGNAGNGAPVVLANGATGAAAAPQTGTSQPQGSAPNTAAAIQSGASAEYMARAKAISDQLNRTPASTPPPQGKNLDSIAVPLPPQATVSPGTKPTGTPPPTTSTLPGLGSPPASQPPPNGGGKNPNGP